ncbi:MAG: hypothetical protein QM758_03315 [Armatimonas sp.]
MDRVTEKNDLLVEIGLLFSDLIRYAKNPSKYSDQEASRTFARFAHDMPLMVESVNKFCKSEPGHDYAVNRSRFEHAVYPINSILVHNPETVADAIPRQFQAAKEAIVAIPVIENGTIQPANSPFATYRLLHDIFASDALKTLTLVDPYVDASIFHRYLKVIDGSVLITLITQEPRANASRTDRDRWNGFVDVSTIFAVDRGSTNYRLIAATGIHDRQLLVDKKRLYHLGGFLKDAGKSQPYTITTADLTPQMDHEIQRFISSGTEWFGPAQQTHLT